MSRQIFLVFFLLLFVCCQLCEQGYGASSPPAQTNQEENTISDFLKLAGGKIEYEFDSKGEKNQQNSPITKVKNIGPVFLAANKDFLVALAEVSSNGDADNEEINVLAKFLKIEENKLGEDAFKGSGNGWKKQLVTETATDLKGKFKVKSFAVVVNNNNKIYYFLVTGTTGGSQLHITVIFGEKNSGTTQNKAMKWMTLDSSKFKLEELNKKLKITPGKIPPVVGFGFSVGKNIVFAIQGEGKGEGSDGKNVTVFFELEETNNVKFLRVETTGKCYCSLFFWKEQIVMVPSVCTDGDKQEMKVFEYKENVFKVSEKQVAFLQEFLKDKRNFVTTKINNTKDALLFTQQCKSANSADSVCLWVTDSKRTAKVGTIITGNKDDFDLSLLHTKNELFALHKTKAVTSGVTEGKFTYNFKRLPDQLNKIKLILEAWKDTDDKIRDVFKKTDTTTTETFLFTDRLVGFLSGSNKDSNAEWKDEYFYENATVTGNGTRAEKGFKFSGKGAGAKWFVGKAIEDQPYNFADSGFTLVATVKIEKDANKKDNSVLGVEIKESTGNTKYNIGLWCNTDNKWAVSDGSSPTKILSATEKCVQEETYQVVLTMEGKDLSMYIDGKKMGEMPKNLKTSQNPLTITHFYFGADITTTSPSATDESYVTVTNVLLYKRPFDEKKEINELKKYVTIKKDTTPPNGNTTPQGGGNDEVTPTPLPPSSTNDKKEKEEKTSSPSRTEDGGVGGGGVRVFSLLLAVLCSAPLLHL